MSSSEEATVPTTAAAEAAEADPAPDAPTEAPKQAGEETTGASSAPSPPSEAAVASETASEASPSPAALSKPPNRTAEIWSTRLHREILALTGEGGDDAAHQHDVETVGVLPPFITLKDHTIDIAKGLCDVTFRVAVEPPSVVPGADGADAGEGARDRETKDAAVGEENSADEADEQTKEASIETGIDENASGKEEATGGETEAASGAANTSGQDPPHVIIMLDASTGTSPDGSPGPAATPSSYPFQAPTAMLISGAHLFPRPGSEINDGDYLDIDLDWTPSLHLNDAILHVALKVRESIRRGEPFYSKVVDGDEGDNAGDNLEAEVLRAKEKVTSFFSSGLTTLRQNASSMASIASEVVAPHNVAAAAGGGVTAAAAAAGVGDPEGTARAEEKKKAKRAVGSETVAIGDEIDLSQSPWNVCAGMYSCNAIRRPTFVELAMSQAEAEAKEEEKVNAIPYNILAAA